MSRRRSAALLLLLAGACLAVAWYGFFFFRDNLSTHYPIKHVSAHILRAGEVPYWNFHDGGGQPLAGNPNTLTFYPDNFLYALLPAHVAFNLHFLLHLVGAWFAMRALSRSPWAAWMYVLSGVAISALSFYNLITAVALVPFALWAALRRRWLLLGCAFGLLALGTEPVTILGAFLAVLIIAPDWRLWPSPLVALIVASPQLIAYAEIGKEVERAHGYSAQTVLNASLDASRFLGFLLPLTNYGGVLFFSLFLGIVVIPALFQRSRWVVVATVMAFLALGGFNPIVRFVVEALPSIRVARYPEKLALPLTIALVMLSARFLERRVWRLITLVPLALFAVLTVPIDRFAPYRVTPIEPMRDCRAATPGGQYPSRDDYRERARRLEPLFGSVAGLELALNRSPDGMHSLLSRIAAERWTSTRNPVYARIAGCGESLLPAARGEGARRADEGPLPKAVAIRRLIGVRSVNEAVPLLESGIDISTLAVAPSRYDGYGSPPPARVLAAEQLRQSIILEVRGPAVVLTNQTYFAAWVAKTRDGRELQTLPLDLDRLGVLVPAGDRTVILTFGRHRTAVVAAWV
ncbi:MAG TPA: hypothetical protein VJ276_07850, partial [Thermoanaerobaculia bacterium]|nr:hypothetical protein [Thermoanaerobaculia bacterium]